MDDHRADDLLGALDGDPVGDLLADLRDELVQLPAREVRQMHLDAMSSGVVTATSPASRRRVIRGALVAAGLKVALVSTAAAATTGALGVGGMLPDPVQRVVADAGSRLGLELPSPPAVTAEEELDAPEEPTEPTVTTTPEPSDDAQPVVVGTPTTEPTTEGPGSDDEPETPDPRRQVAKEEDGDVDPDDRDDDGDDGDDPSDDVEPSIEESVDEESVDEPSVDEPSEDPASKDDDSGDDPDDEDDEDDSDGE